MNCLKCQKPFAVGPDQLCADCSPLHSAIQDTLAERSRQDAKWGPQNHDPIIWSAILTEECGEFAEAALHHMVGGPAAASLRTEAVQVAAVALAIIECLDRSAGKVGCALCDRGDGQLGHSENCSKPKTKRNRSARIITPNES